MTFQLYDHNTDLLVKGVLTASLHAVLRVHAAEALRDSGRDVSIQYGRLPLTHKLTLFLFRVCPLTC